MPTLFYLRIKPFYRNMQLKNDQNLRLEHAKNKPKLRKGESFLFWMLHKIME